MSHRIKEGMEIIGADGIHVGTVDRLDGHRIKLTKRDSLGNHIEHHHYISLDLVAGVEGDEVRLSEDADIAFSFEEEKSGRPVQD